MSLFDCVKSVKYGVLSGPYLDTFHAVFGLILAVKSIIGTLSFHSLSWFVSAIDLPLWLPLIFFYWKSLFLEESLWNSIQKLCAELTKSLIFINL